MKFFFDARYIRTDFHDGISRYSMELAAAVVQQAGASLQVTFLIFDPKQTESLPAGSNTLLIHAPTSAKEPFTSLILNKFHPDVVFSPMQTMGTLGRKFKLILALHDLIYYRHRTPPSNLSWHIRLGWRLFHLSYLPQRLTLNAADIIVTVSETSKKDIEKAKLTKRPIIVVPNAPRDLHALFGTSPQQAAQPPKDLLFMGVPRGYKDPETLIKGMAFLPNRTLHILSRIDPARQAQLEAITPEGASVIFHNGVSDEEYTKLLSNNAILVTATRDEGYGLPVAEALEYGVPIVMTDLPVLKEVAGEAARYFPVGDSQAFAEQVKSLDSLSVRKELTLLGKKEAQRWSWKRSAEVLIENARQLARQSKS